MSKNRKIDPVLPLIPTGTSSMEYKNRWFLSYKRRLHILGQKFNFFFKMPCLYMYINKRKD